MESNKRRRKESGVSAEILIGEGFLQKLLAILRKDV